MAFRIETVAQMSDQDCPKRNRTKDVEPGHTFGLGGGAWEGGGDVLQFSRVDRLVLGGRILGENEPKHHPSQTHSAKDVEHGRPAESLADETRNRHRNDRTELRARKGKRGQRGTFVRWRPLAPEGRRCRKSYAFTDSFDHSQSYHVAKTQVRFYTGQNIFFSAFD